MPGSDRRPARAPPPTTRRLGLKETAAHEAQQLVIELSVGVVECPLKRAPVLPGNSRCLAALQPGLVAPWAATRYGGVTKQQVRVQLQVLAGPGRDAAY